MYDFLFPYSSIKLTGKRYRSFHIFFYKRRCDEILPNAAGRQDIASPFADVVMSSGHLPVGLMALYGVNSMELYFPSTDPTIRNKGAFDREKSRIISSLFSRVVGEITFPSSGRKCLCIQRAVLVRNTCAFLVLVNTFEWERDHIQFTWLGLLLVWFRFNIGDEYRHSNQKMGWNSDEWIAVNCASSSIIFD